MAELRQIVCKSKISKYLQVHAVEKHFFALNLKQCKFEAIALSWIFVQNPESPISAGTIILVYSTINPLETSCLDLHIAETKSQNNMDKARRYGW